MYVSFKRQELHGFAGCPFQPEKGEGRVRFTLSMKKDAQLVLLVGPVR
jgi:hypothetical protein